MNKKILFIVILGLVSICMTGCWNYYELSDLAIITGIGIDKVDDEYKVSLLVANTTDSSSDNNSKAKATVINGKGKNITEAVNDIREKSSKEIYTGHLSLLLIDEKIAKESIYDIIDPFFRDPEATKKILFVIAKDATCNEILKVLSPLESLPSQNIVENIKSSSNLLGVSYTTYLSDFVHHRVNHGYDTVVPSVTIEGIKNQDSDSEELKETELKNNLKISEVAIFNEYKLSTYMTREENKAINIITNKSTSLNLYSNCYNDIDKYTVIKIDSPKTKIDFNINNNKIKYSFDVKASGSIEETNCKINLSDEKVINKIKDYARSDIYEMINNTIKKAKNNESDIFGLENIIYKKNYKYWKKIKNNWNDIYNNLDYEINVDLDLKTKGSLETTLKEVDK